MKITIELDATDKAAHILEALVFALRQSGGAEAISAITPPIEEPQPIHDPQRSVGAYAKPSQKELQENDLVLSLGEGIMKELVDLWEDPDLCSPPDSADEIRGIGCRAHSHKSLLAFVQKMGSLSHAIHHVRIREGKDDGDWQRSEDIALNMTQIASIVFDELSHTYNERFSWEQGDPSYNLYRRAVDNV